MKRKLFFLLVVMSTISVLFSRAGYAKGKEKTDFIRRDLDQVRALTIREDKIEIKKIDFVGNTIFSTEILQELLSPYLQQEVSSLLLIEVANIVTNYYSERGYKSSFAVVARSDLSQGIITIIITEGKIEKIDIDLTGFLSEEYVRSRILARFRNRVFNTNTLAETILLLTNDRNIETINIDINASKNTTGAIVLKATVVASPVTAVRGRFSNNRSPFTGNNEVVAQGETSVFGVGDRLSIITSATKGSTDFGVNYNLPVGINGNFNAFFGNGNDNIIQQPFDVGISKQAIFFNIGYDHQLINKPSQNLFVGVGGSYARSKDLLLDRPFQFTPGANEQGELRVTSLRFPIRYFWRNENNIFSVGNEFIFGLGGVFDSTINESGNLDSTFFLSRSSLEYVYLFSPDNLLYLRGVAQIASDSLPAFERISFGRPVRGFPTATGAGDNGLYFSAEYRYPIWRDEKKQMRLQLVPFVDFATIGNLTQDDPQTPNLVSIGLGLRFEISDRLEIVLNYGEPLTQRNNPNLSGGKVDVTITGTIFRF